MLEIKPFDAWAEADATTDPSEKIKRYADYVRTNAYKNGSFNENSEQEIQQGVYDRAVVDGLISDDEADEDKRTKMQALIGPTQNRDADAKFLLDHYQTDFAAGSPEYSEKAPTIQRYLSLKQTSPESIGDLQSVVDGYLDDKSAVKSARLSAVDRGDYRVIAVDEADGRQLYTGADAHPDNLNGELDSLISNGAISPSDLTGVSQLMTPINGGKSTVAEATRYSVFQNAIMDLAKNDPTIRSSIDQESARIREDKRESQMTTGESIFDGVKKAIAIPFDFASDVVTSAFGMSHPEEKVAAPSELISSNKAITSRFSNTEIDKFLGAFLKRQSGPVYRADRPETGIDVDSLGNPIVSPSLVANKAEFEKALSVAPLNADQKERATVGRLASLELDAPKILKLILGESDQAVSSFAQAKAEGKTDAQFVEDWVGNNSQNYNGFSERLQQLGMSTLSAVATLPVGIGALMGIEPAAKALVAMSKEQSDREEYARLFGDEFGLGFQLINTIPQVATDILATIGTEGAYTAIKNVARGGVKAITREALRGAVSMVDEAAAVAVKNAAKAGGEGLVGDALKGVGDSLASKLSRADDLVPLFATSFTRSASSTYGSIYGQLPDTMSHEEKHKNALGYAIAAGLSTGIITSGMSFLGHGGVEDLATGKFRPATIADDTATNVHKVPLSELNYKQAKFLYENLENAGAKLADGEFKTILRANIGGAYKNYFMTVLKGGLSEGFEEGLDQAIQGRIEDAALDKNTPLAERVNQIFTAFALGGILGAAHPAVEQLVKPLDQSEISHALDARASVLTKVTNDLRKTGSTATAEVLQRQLNDAQAAANERKQLEIAAQQQKQERGKFEEVVTNVDKPISFEPTGQAELPLGDARSKVLPETTRFLSDFEGERAYVGSYAGTLERVGDAIHLNLDEPRTDGVTHLVVGTKFQPLAKSGVRLDRKRLMITGQHNGSIPAGTPYVAPDTKSKQQFALPPEAENVSLIENLADSPILRIKNARLLGQENILSDIILTDKGQIEDALRYYNLEFAELSKPENIQQLDLGLFDDAPAVEPAATPVANPTAIITPPTPVVVKGKGRGKKASVIPVSVDEGKPIEAATTPASALIADAEQTGPVPSTKPRTEEESYVSDLITGNPLALALLEVKRQGSSAEVINKTAQSFEHVDFADLQSVIDKANAYALGLDDSHNGTRQYILGQLEALRVTAEQVRAAKLIPATEPIVAEVPAEVPAEVAPPVVEPAPVSKKPVAAKKVPVTPLPDTTVVSNAEDPAAEADNLKIELAQLEGTLVPLEDDIKQIESNIATAEKESKAPIPSVVREKLKERKDKAKAERKLVDEKATVIKEKIKALTASDPDVDTRTDEDIQADELLKIMLGQQAPSPEAAAAARAGKPQKPFEEKKGVGPVGFKQKAAPRITLVAKGPNPNAPTPIAVYRDGIFRNPVEAELFTNWVAGGLLISNLAEHGYDPKTVSGIPFQQHSVEIKKRLFDAVTERFPLVPVPEGTPDVPSNNNIPNMEAAGRQRSRLPVIHDSNGKVIGGFFTNNPLVVAQQIDKGGLPLFVPKALVGSVNPSIILADKPLKDGRRQVIGVKRFLGDKGVFNAGDISLVGKSGYTPRNVMKSLGNVLRDPASQYLDGAGPSPRNRGANTFETYMNDMMAVSSDVNLEGNSRRSTLGSYENLMSRTFGLDEDVARTAMSNAQLAYANSLKEFALARQIERRLTQARSENPSATLLDLNIPKIILNEATSKNKITPPIEEVAKIITSMYGIKGTPAGILSNYGEYLYNSITSGDMRVGVPPFRTQVIKFARPTKKAETIRNTRARKATGTQEEIDRTLNSIVAEDISGSDATVYDTSIAGQLANTLDANPKVKDLLYRIVNSKFPIKENIDSADLISFAGRALGNYQLNEKATIANYLKNSEDGLDLANALIDLNWLPPVGFKTPTPRDLKISAVRIEPLSENATIEEKKARVGAASRMAKDLYQSEGQGRLLADTARKVNNAEIKRLGIVSNDPASVLVALQNIQESGTPMQRLVAGVLTANPDLIRNVNFVIGDMNDIRFAGAFMPKSNLVAINLSGFNGRGIVDVLLHEYLHAVTIQTMTNPRTPAQIAAMQRIASIRNLTAAHAAKIGFDTTGFTVALQDDMEFITNALTAPEFQSLIRAATPTAQRSLLSRIWESLRSLFGYATTDKKVADAFDELLDFTQMFAGANTFNIRADRDFRLNERNIEEGLNTLREFAANRAELQKYKDVYLAGNVDARSAEALMRSKERDSAYLATVKAGDMEVAQQMVDEAARAAGYDTLPLYRSDATKWNKPRTITYLSPSKELANQFSSIDTSSAISSTELQSTDNLRKFYIKSGLRLAAVGDEVNGKLLRTSSAFRSETGIQPSLTLKFKDITAEDLIADGYDGVAGDMDGYPEAPELAVLASAGIKSADPVARDNNGNVIPLSQRFQTGDADIRYSLSADGESMGEVSINIIDELTKQLPKGMSVNIDSNLKGEAGVKRSQPDVIHINPELLANRVAGLSENAAKASIKGLVNHEIAHAAVLNEFTPEHITRVANELGEEQLQKIAEHYYSSAGLTQEEMLANIEADRASGILSNERIADEWIRMQVEKAVYGRTYEDIVKAAKGNSTLLSTITNAISAFITRLRQRFTNYPSAETAASISQAARTLRKINKSKSVDFNADLYAEGRFGDTANLFATLDGSPVEDQVSYSIPVMSSNEGKVDAMSERLRLYNLPSVLRDIVSLRSGTINQITTASKSLIKYFPKLRDNALKGGVDIEDIKILFGTTAPPLTDADLTEISARTEAYTATLPDTETDARKADLAAEYSEKLKRERRLRFNEAFVKRQAAAEQSIRDAGFKELVDRAVLFRKDINKAKGTIGFDESNDVYLTRAYKFFNTAGWSLAAKAGGIIKIEGEDVDFDKLRANAAAAYYEEAEAEFQMLGKPYTSKDVDDLTLHKLDRYLSSLETMTSAIDQVSVDSIRKDLNRFKPKKDIDSTFRELLGEIEDPLANAINTAFRVGMLSANDRFATDFAKMALDLGLASTDAKTGWRTPFAASSEKTTGALAGLYFDPKVAGVLNEMFGTNMKGLASNSTNLMNNIGRAVMGVSGAAIQMKTQLGFGYWPRNTIGGFIMSAAQGILMNPFSSKGRQSIEQAWRGSFSALGTGEEQRNSILRLIQLNVINDQSQGRAAQDLLKGIIATPEQDLQALMAAVDEARITKDAGGVVARLKSNGYIKGGLAKAFAGYSNVTDFLAALDGAIDASFKVNTYYYELGKIQEHFKDTLSLEAQEEAAARKVKLTFAGHSQVIDAVKSFNKTPMAAVFLPFARWKSEVFRTMINTVPLALEEIKQGGVMARRGMQRLAGFSATITAAPVVLGAAMTSIFRALTGEDEEEERELTAVEMAALRESLPKWQRSHQLKAQVLKGGKIQMIDMSYILPHSQLTDAVGIITDGFRTGEGINGSRLASYVANDLIGTQIAATSLDEVLNNADDRGQPIYLDTDNGLTVMTRVLSHFGKGAVMPSGLSKILDVARSGQTNREELIWGEILGSRPKTVTFGDIERRGFRNLKGLLDNSVSIIGDLTSGRYKSDSEIDDTVDRHQDAMNESQRRMNRFMKSMVSMGSDPSSVYSSAKLYKFSDDTIESAYQGYRIAWRPNDKWNEKTYFNAAQSKEQDPMQKIQSINRSVNRKGSIYYVSGPYDD